MNPRSLGYRTDFIFPRFEGVIDRRGDYWRVLTPSNPTFHWGNFLLFDGPPCADAFARWTALFREEFREAARLNHVAFGWDTTGGEVGDVAPFLNAGYELSSVVVFTARKVARPLHLNPQVSVRPLATAEEWAEAMDIQIACREPRYSYESYKLFKQGQWNRYQAMTRAGLGHWFGAFINGKLVGDLGIYRDGKLGRFQNVGTHPDWRKQGVCATLVYLASQYAFEAMGVDELVMMTEEDNPARRVYEAVGFLEREKQVGISWWQQ